jgi:hypothetical protein
LDKPKQRDHFLLLFDKNSWDTEIDLLVNRRGFDLETARYFTIMKYMHDGDLRPLAAAILTGQQVDSNVYDLAMMICSGEVVAKGRIVIRRPRGRPKQSDKSARDWIMAQRFEKLRQNLPFDKALLKVVDPFKTLSVEAVRKAVTTQRNNDRKPLTTRRNNEK